MFMERVYPEALRRYSIDSGETFAKPFRRKRLAANPRIKRTVAMQLPDEALSYAYQSLLVPAGEEWTPAAELRAKHFLPPGRVRDLATRLPQIRSQIATERDLQQVPKELTPLDAGFIDLPQK